MSEESENLESALIKSIPVPSFRDTFGDLAEIALDSVMEEGLAKDIPFVGSLLKIHAGVVGIRERLFVKKVFKFLFELADISPEEREKWSEKIESDRAEAHKVGEIIIQLLDQSDNMEKPVIIGRLFKVHIQGLLDLNKFQHLSTMVNRAYLEDLRRLQTLTGDGQVGGTAAERLAAVGLLSRERTKAAQAYQLESLVKRGGRANSVEEKLKNIEKQIDQITNHRLRALEDSAFMYRLNYDGELLSKYGFSSES